MRSVLVATDLMRKTDGTLTPLEMNTNSGHELKLKYQQLVSGSTSLDFLTSFDSIFSHEEFHQFLQTNNIIKLKVIDKQGSMGVVFESFANHYNYQYEFISVGEGSATIPQMEDSDDELIIRVSYDTYALVDDLYCRDNFEFHNLIKNESFASPVAFNTGEESNIDTILNFEPSMDGVVPNYIVKPRIPGYPRGIYPKIYRLDTLEELESLKQSITENEFIQKYEYNAELGRTYNRVTFIRSMDLICGSNLEVVNVITYKSISSISTENSLLQYDSELIEGKKLDPTFALKWHPKYGKVNDTTYHFDMTDEILAPDLTTIPADTLEVGTTLFGINFDENLNMLQTANVDTLSTFTTGSTVINLISQNNLAGIFINITAKDELNNEYSWYDGIDNKYLLQKSGSSTVEYTSQNAGVMENGDIIFVFDIVENKTKPLTITNIYFDIKDIDTYKMTLQEDYREFLTKLDGNIYLIQHNFGCSEQCGVFITCGYPGLCNSCGKGDVNCPNCTGQPSYSYVCNSDRRLKHNIVLVGTSESRINIYQFNYIEKEGLFEGVIAQELLGTEFENALVTGEDGMYSVDYSKLDVEFKKLN
jgi:hypothetical protein